MIVCGQCGDHNQEGDAFCGSCGAFLEWEGRKVGVQEPALVAAEEAQLEEKGLIGRVVERLGGTGEHSAADGRAPTDDGRQLSEAVVEHEESTTAALTAEAHERAVLVAEAAERARAEAEERMRLESEAAQAARREAEEAEHARLSAQEAAAREVAEAERLRAQLEQAEASRAEAAAELERERAALERLRAESEQARGEAAEAASADALRTAREAEEARQQAEDRLAAEREAVQQAQAQAEAAERARIAAEERAQAEAAAAAAAAQQAAEAEQARVAAERRVAEEAEAAKRAQRAAALVAKPKVRPPVEQVPQKAAKPTVESPSEQQARKGVQPIRPERRPKKKKAKQPVATERTIRPGDLICGNCGEGNTPTRNFCHRCGKTLKEAEVARRPWWRRLRGPRRRTYEAGERRGRRRKGGAALAKGRKAKRGLLRAFGLATKAAAVLALIGVGGLALGPWRPTVMEWAGDRFDTVRQIVAPQYDPVTASTAEASSEREGHPAGHAIDTLSTTWWAGAAPGESGDSSLLITFPGPVDIAIVGITSGAADVREFAEQARPATLHLLFDNGYDVELEVADRHEFQHFEVDLDRATGVTNVLVRITGVHAGQAGSDVAITELEFKTRR